MLIAGAGWLSWFLRQIQCLSVGGGGGAEEAQDLDQPVFPLTFLELQEGTKFQVARKGDLFPTVEIHDSTDPDDAQYLRVFDAYDRPVCLIIDVEVIKLELTGEPATKVDLERLREWPGPPLGPPRPPAPAWQRALADFSPLIFVLALLAIGYFTQWRIAGTIVGVLAGVVVLGVVYGFVQMVRSARAGKAS
jgi:hypothetical protein